MPNEGFFATAAAVLPILFVALIVEYRYGNPRSYRGGGYPVTQLVVLLLLGAGESAALRAIYYGSASHTARTSSPLTTT